MFATNDLSYILLALLRLVNIAVRASVCHRDLGVGDLMAVTDLLHLTQESCFSRDRPRFSAHLESVTGMHFDRYPTVFVGSAQKRVFGVIECERLGGWVAIVVVFAYSYEWDVGVEGFSEGL